MKNLGGISIDFTEENGKYTTAIGFKMDTVPGKVIVTALVSVVARFARDNKQFMVTFVDELGKLVGMEGETEDD